MKPRLLLDCDGILSDFVRPCLDVLERITGEMYAREDVTTFKIMEALEIPEDVATQAFKEMRTEGFCRSLEVFEGAQEGVYRLKEVAHLFIVTSPLGGPHWASEREEWLHDFFDISPKNVVSTSAKMIVSGDMFVDDKTTALVSWLKCQPGLAVQWETPHNRLDGWQGPSTTNWDELLGMVKALQGRVGISPAFVRTVPGSRKAV